MFRFLQNFPRALELAYDLSHRLLRPFRRWLKPKSTAGKLLTWAEDVGKGAIFSCRMCGQCILHSTGMTCPMTCPKYLRNGPCGGVRADGGCEVKPTMRCVWVDAFERSQRMAVYGGDMMIIQPPVNLLLKGTSAWINMLTGADAETPPGWISPSDIEIGPPQPKTS
jgi:hypothetical protein